jgi:hypothetical protein
MILQAAHCHQSVCTVKVLETKSHPCYIHVWQFQTGTTSAALLSSADVSSWTLGRDVGVNHVHPDTCSTWNDNSRNSPLMLTGIAVHPARISCSTSWSTRPQPRSEVPLPEAQLRHHLPLELPHAVCHLPQLLRRQASTPLPASTPCRANPPASPWPATLAAAATAAAVHAVPGAWGQVEAAGAGLCREPHVPVLVLIL